MNKVSLLAPMLFFTITFLLYWQTGNFEFLNYDDLEYIHKSGAVTNGLSIASVKWAFGPEQCRQMSNWHPVTTLSWMLDVSLFGVNSGAMHLHNAFIHSINGSLLFLFFLMLLRCMERKEAMAGHRSKGDECAVRSSNTVLSIFVAFSAAAFWAWHPLRAESVAWVSSRKDVLSIFFLLPGLMAYLKVLKGGNKAWLFVSGLCYLLAYFSKPTAVVYPLLAVVLEYAVTHRISWRQNELLVYLMFVLMAITFMVQDIGGATVMSLSLMLRLENAVAGIGHYITKTFWPTELSIIYKYEIPIPLHRFWKGSLFLLVVLWFLQNYIWLRVRKYWKERQLHSLPQGGHVIEPSMMIAVGLFWFGLSLVPVIGLIQVGFAACADRYTYLSGIGLSIVVMVGLWKLLETANNNCHLFVWASYLLIATLLFGLGFSGYRNIGNWQSMKTVFAQAIQSAPDNYVAYCNAGGEPLNAGRYEEAMDYYLDSARYMFAELERKRIITPYKDMMMIDLAIAFCGMEGNWVEHTDKGVRLTNDVVLSTKVKIEDPLAIKKLFSQGLYAYWRELDSLAVQYFDEAIKLSPQDDYLWRFKGYSLDRIDRKEEALAAFKRSYSLKPEKDIQERINALELVLGQEGL